MIGVIQVFVLGSRSKVWGLAARGETRHEVPPSAGGVTLSPMRGAHAFQSEVSASSMASKGSIRTRPSPAKVLTSR